MSINQPSTSPTEAQAIDSTSSPPRPRKRPLRTYGRQSTSSKPEHAVKKRKVQHGEDAAPRPSTEELPQIPKPIEVAPAPKPQAKRGSILAYFKPRPAPLPSSGPPSIPDDIPSSDPVERPPSPPPSSSSPRRTRRRLTTKPSFPISTENDPGSEEEEDESTITVKHIDEPLGEVPINTTYTQPGKTEEKEKDKGKRSKSQTPGKELVQTVLNLTINKEPGFLICKDCGTLYNPLNGEDRKEHGRRHKAWMREKRKEDVNASC
ncbi:hypothetical protein QBC44DRAFT_337320 [Cladorrhinum sp. PSN332]|nr:hypothetical protein QBC44DRAFT_337320 [Cladorrhinum sp. PSN332]